MIFVVELPDEVFVVAVALRVNSAGLVRISLTVLLVSIFLCACDRPVCHNTNPIFDNNAPDSREYKAELVKQLALVDPSKLNYWFNEYQDIKRQEQLFFIVQRDGFCDVIVFNTEECGHLNN